MSGERRASGFLTLARRYGAHLRLNEAAPLLTLAAVGLFGWLFVMIAGEVIDGDTMSFDKAILLALRTPGNLADPIGPTWLEESARDFTGLGGARDPRFRHARHDRVSGDDRPARRRVAGRGGDRRLAWWRARAPQGRLRAPPSRPRAARGAGLHRELPLRARDALGGDLPDARRAARPPAQLATGKTVLPRSSAGAHRGDRLFARLSRRALALRRAGRLVLRPPPGRPRAGTRHCCCSAADRSSARPRRSRA